MQKFVIQWHITNRCNLRCKHCYQENYCNDLKLEQLEEIFKQVKEFFINNNFKGHINFTGGEPFTSDNLFRLLELCEENSITFGILTNGSLIQEKHIEKLKTLKCLKFIQVSIDGNREVHDSIRGEGNFDKSLDTLKKLHKANIKTMVSFTISKKNMHCIKDVIKTCNKVKVDRFWMDRLVPIGSNNLDCISTKEYKICLDLLSSEIRKSDLKRKLGIKNTYIHNNRALQFMCNLNTGRETATYECSAGKNLLVISESGDLLPCRRLPLILGNLLHTNIEYEYKNNKILQDIRSVNTPDSCKNCIHKSSCNGGAKCLTYALTGKLSEKDVNCWL